MKIMIVDDNQQMRRFIRHYFWGMDISIVELSNGFEAVEKFGDLLPDLVLMDIKMPVMDGLEATRRIIELYPSAKIIIVTEYDDIHLREEAEKAGAHGYVLKDNLSLLRIYYMHSA
jgi:CheY-like chemotaxis protein